MTDEMDYFQNGDVLGMLEYWREFFTNFFAEFARVFGAGDTTTQAVQTEQLADTSSVPFTSMLGDFTVAFAIVAVAWVVFVLLTHSPLWKRLTSIDIPAPVAYGIGGVLGLLALVSFVAFALSLDASIYMGGVQLVIALLIGIPIIACLGAVLEKARFLFARK